MFPDSRGYYGRYGGKFVPETLELEVLMAGMKQAARSEV